MTCDASTAPLPVSGVSPDRPQTMKGLVGVLNANANLLILIGIFAAYGRGLFQSLWTDEAGMFWMARGGVVAAIQKTWHWPGQSILYSAITSFFCFDGSPLRDTLLRIPALLGAAAACYFLFRFADDAIGKGAGRIAAVLFLFNPATIGFATQARPYTFAMAAAACSCWTLYRWTQSRERSWLISYILSTALVFYFHYIFAPILAAHAALLAWEVLGKRRYEKTWELVAGYALLPLLLLPIGPHILLMARQSHTFRSVAHDQPSSQELSGILMPVVAVIGLVASALLIQLLHPNRRKNSRLSGGVTAMLLVWWLAGPLLLFVISRNTSLEIFNARYASYSGLAFVMIASYAGFSFFGAEAGLAWSLLAVLITTGNPLSLIGPHPPSEQELGPAMQIIQQETTKESTPPVLVRSDLTEADDGNWRAGNAAGSYLYDAFVAYPMPNELVPLPYRLTEPVKSYISRLVEGPLKNRKKVIFLTHDPNWISFVNKSFEQAGFTGRMTNPNDYYVVVFERTASGGS